jgi:hypothetical protein
MKALSHKKKSDLKLEMTAAGKIVVFPIEIWWCGILKVGGSMCVYSEVFPLFISKYVRYSILAFCGT